jgi:hypothetical protein
MPGIPSISTVTKTNVERRAAIQNLAVGKVDQEPGILSFASIQIANTL